MKAERKKELNRLKKEEFGSSSSEDNAASSEEDLEEIKRVKKVESKASKGKDQLKGEGTEATAERNSYSVILELKKTFIENELLFSEKDFEINKRTLSFVRISRLGLAKSTLNGKTVHKLRIGMGGDEDVILSLNPKLE